MRYLAVLAFFALALSTGCSNTPGGAEKSKVMLSVGASTHTPTVGDTVVLNADVTSRGRVYFISFLWFTAVGPSAPVFQNSSDVLTNVRFTAPGDYRITMRIYWWDRDNERRTTDASVAFTVAPAPPVAPG